MFESNGNLNKIKLNINVSFVVFISIYLRLIWFYSNTYSICNSSSLQWRLLFLLHHHYHYRRPLLPPTILQLVSSSSRTQVRMGNLADQFWRIRPMVDWKCGREWRIGRPVLVAIYSRSTALNWNSTPNVPLAYPARGDENRIRISLTGGRTLVSKVFTYGANGRFHWAIVLLVFVPDCAIHDSGHMLLNQFGNIQSECSCSWIGKPFFQQSAQWNQFGHDVCCCNDKRIIAQVIVSFLYLLYQTGTASQCGTGL